MDGDICLLVALNTFALVDLSCVDAYPRLTQLCSNLSDGS